MNQVLAAILFLAGVVSVQTASGASIDEARALYLERNESPAGSEKAKQAYDMLKALPEGDERNLFLAQVASYRADLLPDKVGGQNNQEKIDLSLEGVALADFILKANDIDIANSKYEKAPESEIRAEMRRLKRSKSEEQLNVIAEAIYYRTSAFGNYLSVVKTDALARKHEVLKINFFIEGLCKESVADYGIYRIQGRVFENLPEFLGGGMKKAYAALTKAYQGSRHPEHARFGVGKFGATTRYYAEHLFEKTESSDPEKDKKAEAAKRLLTRFICLDESSLQELHPDQVPENKRHQRLARERMAEWGASPGECQ